MIGVTLSRWTMSYFAAALVALIAAECLMAAGIGYPSAPFAAAGTLILVHVVAIGWLSLLLCGALLQFLPVLVARPLYSGAMALPALACLVAGLAALIGGFLQLGGAIPFAVPLFAPAAALLGLGFALVLWNLACTMLAAGKVPMPARFVTVGLVSLVFTVGLGAVFALVLGGQTGAEPLQALFDLALPVHAVAGLAGWLTFTAVGVSYRLLAMFMLAPEDDRKSTRGALGLGTLALAVAVPGGIAAALAGRDPGPVLLVAFGSGLAAAGFYAADMVHLYRSRRRPKIELNSRMAAAALGSLGAAMLLAAVLVALGRFGDRMGAVVFLAAFGWLSGLGLAQLYKITAFLTWLECYGPVMGKTATPRVQDLVVETRARRWFRLYFAATWAGAAALLAGFVPGFRVAALAMLLATLGLANEFLRTRRLADVADGTSFLRLPPGTRQPRLLLSNKD